MYNSKATLYPQTIAVNDAGDSIATDGTGKTVFCKIVSANEKEKAYAESRGETAELVLILPDKQLYNGELAIAIGTTRYKVVDVKTDETKEAKLVVRKWARQ